MPNIKLHHALKVANTPHLPVVSVQAPGTAPPLAHSQSSDDRAYWKEKVCAVTTVTSSTGRVDSV